MITLTMNGVDYTSHTIDGLAGITISARTVDGVLQREITSELIFRGDAYQFLYDQFVASPSAVTNQVIINIHDDCCDNYDFEGLISLEGLTFCSGDCEMKVHVVEYHPEFTCFKSTVIFDNWNGFQYRSDHPRITYCNELRPNWLMHVIIIFMIIFNITSIVMVPIIAVVSVIVAVVCLIINLPFIPGDCPDNLNNGILDDYFAMLKEINTAITGCGRKHPSPLAREYIKNVCAKCGLNFKSSILNDPLSEYYNTVYFNAPVKKGQRVIIWPIYENFPLLACDMLLDQLRPVFTAEYTIRGTDLVFERKDKLKNTDIVFDFLQADRSKLETMICYSWDGTKKPAYMDCHYSKDGVDLVGDEAAPLYNDIVDFNNPMNPAYSGHLEKAFQFGTPRFRQDGIEEDVLEFWSHVPIIKSLITPYDNCLLLAQHTSILPKLMIWDGVSDVDNARIKIYPTPYNYEAYYPQVEVNIPYQLFNYPYYVDADFNTAQKNLWEFQKIEDPRDLTNKNLKFDLTFKYECGDLPKLTIWSGVVLDQGIGTIEEYTIDFVRRTVSLSGTV